MNDAIENIPPEAWPMIGLALNTAAILAVVWVLISLFVHFRRRSSNLTPVEAARRKKSAQPDFLSVDHAKRAAALERGDAFESELQRREAAEAPTGTRAEKVNKPLSIFGLIARLLSLVVSVFSLATVITGTTWQVSRMGDMIKEYNTVERITAVVTAYPVSSSIAAIVILFHIYQFARTLTRKPFAA